MASRAELLRRLKRLERPAEDVGALQAELDALRAAREADRARALAPGTPRQLLQDHLVAMMACGGTIHTRMAELEAKLTPPAERVAATARVAEFEAKIATMTPAELAALVAERQARPGPTPAG